MGLEFVTDRSSNDPAPEITMEIINRCCEAGLLVGRVGVHGNVIRVAPPLVMTAEEAEEAADLMEKIIRSLA